LFQLIGARAHAYPRGLQQRHTAITATNMILYLGTSLLPPTTPVRTTHLYESNTWAVSHSWSLPATELPC